MFPKHPSIGWRFGSKTEPQGKFIWSVHCESWSPLIAQGCFAKTKIRQEAEDMFISHPAKGLLSEDFPPVSL